MSDKFNKSIEAATTLGMDALLYPPATRRAREGAREFIRALIGDRGCDKQMATLVVAAAEQADEKNNYWRGWNSLAENVRAALNV